MRRVRTKKLLSLLLAAVLALTIAGCGKDSGEVRFGTGGTGGTYYAYGSVLGEVLSTEKMTFDVKTTAGSSANLRLLSEDYVRLAFAQTDQITDAWNGDGAFDGRPLTGYKAVASLYDEHCQLVASAASGIQTVEDLAGKRVSVGEEESGVIRNAEQILLAYGLTFEMLGSAEHLSFSDAAAAVADGKLDAFFCTAGVPTSAVANLARTTEIVLVPQEAEKLERLTELYPGYTSSVIPANTYPGQTGDVPAVAVRAALLASDKLTEEQVYAITSGLFANASALQNATPSDTPLSLEHALDGVTIPFHPGAAKFYSENGVTVETEG